jgi:hypothetical protein
MPVIDSMRSAFLRKTSPATIKHDVKLRSGLPSSALPGLRGSVSYKVLVSATLSRAPVFFAKAAPAGAAGTFTPAFLAFESPMAITCFGLRTPCFPSRTWMNFFEYELARLGAWRFSFACVLAGPF